MNYIYAIVCPPVALLKAGKPVQATFATLILILAFWTWSIGLGVLLLASLMIWACRGVGDAVAAQEVAGFKRLIESNRAR